MAFNFNWSPLTADAEFYQRAQEMLTTALNKSPKPPIIKDDILVNEFNLGSVPPELEILEIGDLAEDRFRGIFKMCYSGDAFLTLKTRVQANPLNNHLFSKPSFTSPQPLAADAGLTIPLQITLSEIKLSAFIILVFSRQKGLTLVFRNDPLESLKVSSTFDSIPFIKDYLQKEIEMQLRTLMMEELPAIIHRLSLRLWCPEYRAKEDQEMAQAEKQEKDEVAVDPFASPPLDAVDARGNVLDASEISSLSLDGGSEIHSLFSQKNLLRLAALTNSHRTLSLFTPSIRDAVFRAWAGPSERGDSAGSTTPATPSLVRSSSSLGGSSSNTYTFTNKGSEDEASQIPSRPSLVNMNSATTGLSLGAGRHSRSHAMRKKKTRVVNLRKSKTTDDVSESEGSGASETASILAASEPAVPTHIPEEPEDNLVTPPNSPHTKVRFTGTEPETPKDRRPSQPTNKSPEQTALESSPSSDKVEPFTPIQSRPRRPTLNHTFSAFSPEKSASFYNTRPFSHTPHLSQSSVDSPGGILEQAWIMKMANELTRRQFEEKTAREGLWSGSSERDDIPPPAYEPKAL
ncbi:ERMES complex subunit [Clarireedia jacksonii]